MGPFLSRKGRGIDCELSKEVEMVEVEWRRHRADQLREKAKEDAIVIVPVGSLEQHGPHLPVEIDSLLGEAVALRTARLAVAKEPGLVLPLLWNGLSEHSMSFGRPLPPGTAPSLTP